MGTAEGKQLRCSTEISSGTSGTTDALWTDGNAEQLSCTFGNALSGLWRVPVGVHNPHRPARAWPSVMLVVSVASFNSDAT